MELNKSTLDCLDIFNRTNFDGSEIAIRFLYIVIFVWHSVQLHQLVFGGWKNAKEVHYSVS